MGININIKVKQIKKVRFKIMALSNLERLENKLRNLKQDIKAEKRTEQRQRRHESMPTKELIKVLRQQEHQLVNNNFTKVLSYNRKTKTYLMETNTKKIQINEYDLVMLLSSEQFNFEKLVKCYNENELIHKIDKEVKQFCKHGRTTFSSLSISEL